LNGSGATDKAQNPRSNSAAHEITTTTVVELPITSVEPDPDQPRKYFDPRTLEELARSIKEHGLLQPVLVRPIGNGKYVVVHGERRFRAHKLANLPVIRCFVKEIDLGTVRDLQLTENLQRNDLSDMELAYEFQRRVDSGQTHQQIAEKIGKTRAFVTQRVALLRLPKEVQNRVLTGTLSFSNARQLLQIKDESTLNEVGSQLTPNTTVIQAESMIKGENVTRVTKEENTIVVSGLAVYRLLAGRATITSTELLAAIGQDLRLLRGE
jgi:ParB family chromosome partitioning protein